MRALDAGIDGITLAAGLHLGSFALMEDHPRFRDAKLGIIVSSLRALQLFLRKNAALNRLPDYVVVEGPLAGGHLGFGMDWAQYDLRTIVAEIRDWLKAEKLDIPLIPAGGIFTGSDAVALPRQRRRGGAGGDALHRGAGMRPARRREAGILQGQRGRHRGQQDFADRLPDAHAEEQPGDRRRHPAELRGLRLSARRQRQLRLHQCLQPRGRRCIREASKISVRDKTCLCTHMRNFDCWTCGHYTYRLKDTTRRLPDGSYQLLTAEHIFRDYQFSIEQQDRATALIQAHRSSSASRQGALRS